MINNRQVKIPATASLLRRYHKRGFSQEIYEKAIRCYDVLIESIQNPSVSEELSLLLDIPAADVRKHAADIVNSLLVNRENDPYLSFGLVNGAPMKEVNRRWKILMALYHPDRHSNDDFYEEKAVKINEMRNRIQELQGNKAYLRSFNSARAVASANKMSISDVKYLRYLPYVILITAVILSLLSILLFIFTYMRLPEPKAISVTFTTKERGLQILHQGYAVAAFKPIIWILPASS